MVHPGEQWERPATGPPDAEVRGDDAALATRAAARQGALIRFYPAPGSDLARSLGLAAAGAVADADRDSDAPRGFELGLDLLECDGRPAVNAFVAGTAPVGLRPWSRRHRFNVAVDDAPPFTVVAFAVVVASGQFVDSADVNPRSHPGDGRFEVAAYAIRRSEVASVRRRLTTGSHVPHPRIVQRSGTRVRIDAARSFPIQADGHALAPAAALEVVIVPGAFRLAI